MPPAAPSTAPSSSPSSSPAPDLAALRAMLKSQYRSALAMLREAIELCPDEIWEGGGYTNACWQQAYHALFFDFFLSIGEGNRWILPSKMMVPT